MRGAMVCSREKKVAGSWAAPPVTITPPSGRAIMGPNMVNQLAGGAGGFRHAHDHMSHSAETWLADMATWTHFPEGWSDFAQKGVNEEMAHRPAEFGRTNEEIIRVRDNMLLEILHMHKKI